MVSFRLPLVVSLTLCYSAEFIHGGHPDKCTHSRDCRRGKVCSPNGRDGRNICVWPPAEVYCDSYTCPECYVPVHACEDIECKDGACDYTQCCEHLLHCDSYTCSEFHTPLPDPADIECMGGACDECQCCELDACSPNPCRNGGTCELDVGGGHVCFCPSGYGGMACQTNTTALDPFYITMDFNEMWTPEQQAVFQSAAYRWAQVITHVPCGGADIYPAGQLLISASLEEIDGLGDILGYAGPEYIWDACKTISLTGLMVFDIDDIQLMEDLNIFDDVIMHEMGHVIGVGSLWGDCSTCRSDMNPNWKCPATVAVYNDLLRDPDGTDAYIIELSGGPGTACAHFSEMIFQDELMTGYVNPRMYLSKITAASLEDTGYIVDASKVDSYTLPALRFGESASADPVVRVAEDNAVANVIGFVDENGEVVGQIDGVKMKFNRM